MTSENIQMEIEMLIYHEQSNIKWGKQMFHSVRCKTFSPPPPTIERRSQQNFLWDDSYRGMF